MKRIRPRALVVPLVILAAAAGPHPANVDAVDGIEVADGLEAVVFAESPMLTNPTNLDVDARGRVWVVEGYNYRNSLHPDQPVREEGDRVVILEDTDGDGKADLQKVFYQGRDIDAAMGIVVLGNEVIVSAYEHVLLLTDTDGDDRADTSEVLFRMNGADHDHTVHAFTYGPDGRFYFNAGDEGRFVLTPAGDTIVDLAGNRVSTNGNPYRKGMTFRWDRETGDFEVLGHNFRNPYEAAVDAFGTVWQSDNDDDGNRAVRINYVMEGGNFGYTDEFTGAGWRTPRTGMTDSIPLRHWHQNDPGVVPNVLQTGAGSPAGLMIYEGSALPERFRNAMIHAEAGMRVVRAYPVESDGAGYRGRIEPILTGREDQLFRPVDVAAGPDGSLFVADWYDEGVGGHNVRNVEYGRIIRVTPTGGTRSYRPTAPDLSTADGAVRALSSPNHATRYLAHRRLRELNTDALPALRDSWRKGSPREKARALWLLAEFPGIRVEQLALALKDPDPDLRIAALRVARRNGRPTLPMVEQLVDDPSPQVRREAILTLRHQTDPKAAELWSRLAAHYDGRDRWYLEALGLAADRQWDAMLAAWMAGSPGAVQTPDLVWRARTDAALPLLARLIADPAADAAARARYFRAFDFHRGPGRDATLLTLLGAGPEIAALALTHLRDSASISDPRVAPALAQTLDALGGAGEGGGAAFGSGSFVAAQPAAPNASGQPARIRPLQERSAADAELFVRLAAKFEARDRIGALVSLAVAQPESSAGVSAAQLALQWGGAERFRTVVAGGDPAASERAIAVLGRAGGAPAMELLGAFAVAADRDIGQRRAAVQALGASQTGERLLLQLVSTARLPDDLKPTAASLLFASFREAIREEAAKFLTPPAATTADGRTLPAVGELARRRGDAAKGRVAFAKACVACHTAAGTGTDFGPGLSDIGGKLSRAALYNAILEPSAGVSFNYAGETLRLTDGTEVTGIVASETSSEVVLRQMGGISTRYPTARISGRTRLAVSLMPDGLERALTEQELVDLVEYLSTLR